MSATRPMGYGLAERALDCPFNSDELIATTKARRSPVHEKYAAGIDAGHVR